MGSRSPVGQTITSPNSIVGNSLKEQLEQGLRKSNRLCAHSLLASQQWHPAIQHGLRIRRETVAAPATFFPSNPGPWAPIPRLHRHCHPAVSAEGSANQWKTRLRFSTGCGFDEKSYRHRYFFPSNPGPWHTFQGSIAIATQPQALACSP
jgi:hypothetical protein